jgi:hypothetical protein
MERYRRVRQLQCYCPGSDTISDSKQRVLIILIVEASERCGNCTSLERLMPETPNERQPSSSQRSDELMQPDVSEEMVIRRGQNSPVRKTQQTVQDLR